MIAEENESSTEKNEERMTLPILTKYEKARILSLRASQIIRSSALWIHITPEELQRMTAMEIAEKEFEMKKIPFVVRRFFPDKSFEDWSLNELKDYNSNLQQ